MAGTGRRYTEEQIIAILKEAEAAKSAAEVIRRHGISWKAKYAGMEVSEAKRLKALEGENRRWPNFSVGYSYRDNWRE